MSNPKETPPLICLAPSLEHLVAETRVQLPRRACALPHKQAVLSLPTVF